MFDVSREMGSSVALYSRKVLIQTKATDILPKWLRFLRGSDVVLVIFLMKKVVGFPEPCVCAGVVDSEDIPLNLSRELLQESVLIRYRTASLFFKISFVLFHCETSPPPPPPGSFATFCSRG